MVSSYTLLPRKNMWLKLHAIGIIVMLALVWCCNGLYHQHLLDKKKIAVTTIATLKEQQRAMSLDPSTSKNQFIYAHTLMTESSISLSIIQLLKRFPTLKVVNLNDTLNSEKKKVMSKRGPHLPKTQDYVKLLQGQKLLTKRYHLILRGPFRDLNAFLTFFMKSHRSLLLQQLVLSGKNHPADILSLNFAYFSQKES